MGNLLRLLSRDVDPCCSLPKCDIFVDFENAQPRNELESSLYYEAESVLERSTLVLKELENYEGASQKIREAITKPTKLTEENAWKAVLPLVGKLQVFYEFSKDLTQIIPKILLMLCNPNKEDGFTSQPSKAKIPEQLDDHQAIVKQFAKILEFVLKFDECKMTTPAVQNDFSYYRRTIQRNRHSSEDPVNGNEIGVEMANAMSLFFAHSTPMLNALSETTSKFAQLTFAPVAKNAPDMLSVMAKVCQKMLDTPSLKSRLQFESTELFILRVMVASIILYDHVHPSGAFAKGSCVDVKGCIKVLRDQPKARSESLLNALRYTTKHVNDENTPKGLKSVLFEDIE
ncbi:hypothetical protein TCAL_13862 [Tigriopus californicus]|uniref:CYRIA/CYRIB Rac1 binding domain-containing protein n=1 Tax=Tigriopus californicus TaxID=6832 RepID=A0A553N6S2_TIGCA|nr:CYFIP-related Rac1 interactor B-like [Tigriopus californicus]TRY61139.1 hypothetical protein TCAL_13862 [Tigriopus californicus]|eukprot:TCALIF_13862-PA protein Name:"Similar to FAM49B Protein FAM49B (Homo sapiens)" AED:0.02 eAED:0.02 QI:75/1/1/1/0.75/0.8/5/206/343